MANVSVCTHAGAFKPIAPAQWSVTVIGNRGGLVTRRFFTDKTRARDFFTDCLARDLDYKVEFERCDEYELY